MNRRSFLRLSTLAAAPLVLPSGLRAGAAAPSRHVRIALVGCGSRAQSLVGALLGLPDARIVLACDCFADRRQATSARINKHYAADVCAPAADYLEAVNRPDIDGVVVATPDHWHVPVAYAAAKAGKDLYVEKPLSPALRWAMRLRKVANEKKIVFQYGTQQRGSQRQFVKAVEFVRNGYIGKVNEVVVWAPDMASEISAAKVQPYGSIETAPVPEGFDYDRWLGPAPDAPYTIDRCTRFGAYHIYDYSIGFLGGWGSHPLDIAQWGLDTDHTSPVRYEGTGLLPLRGRLWNTVEAWDIHCRYATGVRLRFMSWRFAAMQFARANDRLAARAAHGTRFIGEDGWIQVDRSALLASDRALQHKDAALKPGERPLKHAASHMRDFIDCMKTRQPTLSPLESAIRSDTISHLSDLVVRLGRPIDWDPEAEKIINDPEADALLDRPLRPAYAHLFNA
jgi:predicted dehydrogenase